MRPTMFIEYKIREINEAHHSENDRLRELLQETVEELKQTTEQRDRARRIIINYEAIPTREMP